MGRDGIGNIIVDGLVGRQQIGLFERNALIVQGNKVGSIHITDLAVIGQIFGIVELGTLVDYNTGHDR